MEFLAANHPKVIHFAVAFLVSYPFIELLAVLLKKDYLEKTAHMMLFLGVISAIGAVLTGQQAEEVAEKWEDLGAIIPFGQISQHQQFATITVWYFGSLLAVRTALVVTKKYTGYIKYVVVVAAITGLYFIYQTGEYGGRLVFKHGVGTELKKQEIEGTK